VLNEQLVIPGLESSSPPKPKKPPIQRQIADLQSRVLQLELELTLLRVQLGG